ncbi:CopG family transcriptional regulator [Chromobacterium sp. Panama]|uniref:CopG family ribbon-helix-helix protein n=1 Tax=Chromobacterium sp. Panama TaxID=2161826 RepID=UPI000D326D0C|nr:ribbon-helix-helix domain-containing protein [Chromobacterium sp. Panama]PTU66944.1 CopG family transcriptional regulator [Chromobacterium sp. Panama]
MSDHLTRVITAHVPASMADKIDYMAGRKRCSRDWIMTQALSAWIEREEELEHLTQEALADVDLGQVISHQAVIMWAERLGADSSLMSTGKEGE